MRRIVLFVAPALLLASCATTDPGWHGTGAQPFDSARDTCEAQVLANPDPAGRAEGFEECMRGQGWNRGKRN